MLSNTLDGLLAPLDHQYKSFTCEDGVRGYALVDYEINGVYDVERLMIELLDLLESCLRSSAYVVDAPGMFSLLS